MISTHNSGVLEMVRMHLRLSPPFFDAIFCTGSVWELSWGAKSLLTALAESVGNPLNHSLASKYEFVLWGDGISGTYEFTQLFESAKMFQFFLGR